MCVCVRVSVCCLLFVLLMFVMCDVFAFFPVSCLLFACLFPFALVVVRCFVVRVCFVCELFAVCVVRCCYVACCLLYRVFRCFARCVSVV